MNQKRNVHFALHAMIIRLLLVSLLLMTSSSIAVRPPAAYAQAEGITQPDDVAQQQPDAQDTQGKKEKLDKKKDKAHSHHHGKELKLGLIERSGSTPQQQQTLAAPVSPKGKHVANGMVVGSDVDGEDTGEELANKIYIPFITQGSDGTDVQAAAVTKTIDMKLLVIAADGNETDFPAIKAFLNQLGIPYDVLIGTQTELTWNLLSNGYNHGYYQGIILTTGNLGYNNPNTNQWESVFDGNEWFALWTYEQLFGVRQVTSYTYPGGWPDTYGLTDQGYTTEAIEATLTAAGQQVYPYLKPDIRIPIANTWTYLATITDPNVTTPLVTYQGYAIASIHHYADGRENLAVTMGNNPYLVHSLLLSYGTINWVTKGLFLGERHAYINPQVDDLLIESDMWDTQALTDTTGLTFRTDAEDLLDVIAWQNNARATHPFASTLTLEMAFNGEGAVGDIYDNDTLTPAVIAHEEAFNWVSHTLTHENLDAIPYATAMSELTQNHLVAINPLGLTNYHMDSLVQPDISGLYHTGFANAAKDFGLKYLISDTSRPSWDNPTPNAGYYWNLKPGILVIPRRPTNLFYNLRTPEEWVSEYNCFYGPNATCAGGRFSFWPQDLTFAEILDVESDLWLQYLLKWDIDPLMFHQANLGSYDGTHSLLGDLIDATLAKYGQYTTLPIVGISQHDIGIKMAARMAYNASGVRASMIPCQSITITTNKPAVIPMTGLSHGANIEVYGGQSISYVQMGTNQSLTIPAPACP
ncbi:MAG: hypothetical protein KDE19_18480 [Caldilineaceae bacterium]|nr:hypothetical protein [Caldilineaceae bacterium]